MQRTLLTFTNTELRTMRRLLQADIVADEKTGDYMEMEYSQIITDKITEELLYRIADGA